MESPIGHAPLNAIKQRRSVRSKSGYVGVTRSGASNWSASVHVGRPRYLGSLITAEGEPGARDRAVFEAWGEFATLDYPDEYRGRYEETPTPASVEVLGQEQMCLVLFPQVVCLNRRPRSVTQPSNTPGVVRELPRSSPIRIAPARRLARSSSFRDKAIERLPTHVPVCAALRKSC